MFSPNESSNPISESGSVTSDSDDVCNCDVEPVAAPAATDYDFDESLLYCSDAAIKPLYDGSNTTVLQALVKNFHWFTEHPGVSKEALSSMLSMQHAF